jgi:hypothetical protein
MVLGYYWEVKGLLSYGIRILLKGQRNAVFIIMKISFIAGLNVP